MKYIAIFLLAVFALPASAQEVTQTTRVTGNLTPAIPLPATTTDIVGTTTVISATTSTTTLVETITEVVEPIVEEVVEPVQEVITEVVPIIPGGLSVTLSATPPAQPVVRADSLDDGLFNLIYAGFEEFVFKVFGW